MNSDGTDINFVYVFAACLNRGEKSLVIRTNPCPIKIEY